MLEADGVFVVAGLSGGEEIDRYANRLLTFFNLPSADKLHLATRLMRANSPRSYRGYCSSLKDGGPIMNISISARSG